MTDTRAHAWAISLRERLMAEPGPDHLRLISGIVRLLARGHPLSAEEVDRLIAELGIAPEGAHQFLRHLTERDASDRIVGAMGLSLQDHPHRLSVAGQSLSAWCALDTLFLPAILGQTAVIESPSPVSGQPIWLRVSPQRVEEVRPAAAVVSLALVDVHRAEFPSVEALWGAFCSYTHFFASRAEGEQWAGGREDLAVVTVDEGFAVRQQMWPMQPILPSSTGQQA